MRKDVENLFKAVETWPKWKQDEYFRRIKAVKEHMTNTEETKNKIFNFLCEHSVDLMGDTHMGELAECLDVPYESVEEEKELDGLFDEVFQIFCNKIKNLTLDE